jgi:RHS repeat-associated protein
VAFTHNLTFGFMTSASDGFGNTTYTYGSVGNAGALQVQKVNGPWSNDTIQYTYDALGRLTQHAVTAGLGGSVLQSENYVYDPLNRLTALSNNLSGSNDTLSYLGNSAEVSEIINAVGMNTTFGYLAANEGAWLANITNNETSGANTTLFSADAYTLRGDGSIATWQQSFGWAPNISPANLTENPVQQQLYTFGYDDSGWLVNATLGAPNKTVNATLQDTYDSWIYTYDGSGNPLTQNVSGYDAANSTSTLTGNFTGDNQLTSLTRSGKVRVSGFVDKPAVVTVNAFPARQWSLPGGRDFAFDSALPSLTGNGNTGNVTVDALDAAGHDTFHVWQVFTGNTAANFTYDANGDTVSETDNPGSNISVTSNYTWDALGRLLSYSQGNSTVTFTYDWMGRRVSLSANVSGNVTTQNFLWDGDSIVQRRDGGTGSSNTAREYFGNGYQTINGSFSSDYFYTRDHLGSIREVVASDGKTVEGRYSYGPWGETTYMDYSNGTVAQPDFGYAGYMQTSYVPGLYFTPNRVYSTTQHRWLSRDPAGEAGGTNLYGYGGNDPVNFTDSSGLFPVTEISNVAALIQSALCPPSNPPPPPQNPTIVMALPHEGGIREDDTLLLLPAGLLDAFFDGVAGLFEDGAATTATNTADDGLEALLQQRNDALNALNTADEALAPMQAAVDQAQRAAYNAASMNYEQGSDEFESAMNNYNQAAEAARPYQEAQQAAQVNFQRANTAVLNYGR